MPDLLFAEAFVLWGSPTTWLEVIAVAVSLLMVWCNIREIHWGWPLAIVASAMYWAIFWRSGLYGEAGLQVVFIVVAGWGWRQWLRGGAGALHVARLSRRGWALTLAACAGLWPLCAVFLERFTDSTVPWWDAFPTALSLVAQYLLGRKFLENWTGWIVVNLVSVALFVHKGLWLTVGLYALFIALSVAGWRAWRRQLP